MKTRSAAVCIVMLVAGLWAVTALGQSTGLHVKRISPSGVGVSAKQEAVIQFDRAMVPLGHMGRKTATLPVSISPEPGCQWRWLNTSELACRLPKQQRFAPATHYTITVGTALTALDGSHLAEPEVRTFTTSRPKVKWTSFQKWRSPVMPVFKLVLNVPVTAKQLAAHVGFVDKAGAWHGVKVEPFKKNREGPILLPMPGVPGAVLFVDMRNPDHPLDVHATAGAGRRVWKVTPRSPLAARADYALRVRAGMHTPLGPLGGPASDDLADVSTYGDFAFQGIECDTPHARGVRVKPAAKHLPHCQPDSVRLAFSNPIPRATLATIQWQPMPMSDADLAKTWAQYPKWLFDGYRQGPHSAKDGYELPLKFALKPMQTYTLTVPGGVKDHFGRVLSKSRHVTFRTGHRVPFFAPPSTAFVLEARQSTMAPIDFVNLERLSLRWRGLTAVKHDGTRKPSARHVQNLLTRSDLAAHEDQVMRGSLGIRRLLKGRSGVVHGRISWRGKKPHASMQHSIFLGEVTPYQVFAKAGYFGTLVWVSRLDNGQPVAGAKVRLLRSGSEGLHDLSRVVAVATTGPAGLARLPGTMDFPLPLSRWGDHPRSRFFVAVAHDDASALLPLTWGFNRSVGAASSYDFRSDTVRRHGHMRAWAVTEQGIYKPGGEVKLAVFVRAQAASALKAPPALDYTLAVTDARGNTVLKRQHVKLSVFGGWHGKLHLADTASMGWYRITVSWPSGQHRMRRTAGRFLVTDFTPATFKVHTQVRGKRFHPGQKISVKVGATLHAGGPYTGAKTKIRVRLKPQRFSPDTAVTAGYAFGDQTQSLMEPRTLAFSEGQLDASGHMVAHLALPDDSHVLYGEVHVEGEVASPKGKWIVDTASVPYAAHDRMVGLRTPDWMQHAGKPFKVDYVLVDLSGQARAGGKVILKFERHVSARKAAHDEATDNGDPRWIGVGQCHAVSGTAPGSCTFTAPAAGRYRVVASVVDTHGHTQRSVMRIWVVGAGVADWSQDDNVTLVPDKTSYRVGDTAHVLVQNPYPGARALITVERYDVLWKKVVTLKGSAPIISVPIKTEDFPGAFLSVAIFSPRTAPPADPDHAKPTLVIGYIALKVEGKGDSLKVDVTPAHATYKPRQVVDVDVAVHTRDGKAPGKTQLVVAVVDQGVLDLLQEGVNYYDPRSVFYAPPTGPDVRNFDLTKQLLTALHPKTVTPRQNADEQNLGAVAITAVPAPPAPPAPPKLPPPPAVMELSSNVVASPGGTRNMAAMPRIRSVFKHAVYWNADLSTDAAGHAHFHFKLPDNLTRWRILVIALRPGAAMGLGKDSVRVNLPLQIKSALPHQMHVGDHVDAAFNVTNRTDAPLTVTTHTAARGAIDGGHAASTHTLDLASFGHDLAWLPLTASKPGVITLTGTARAGKLGDAVKASIPVTRAGAIVVAAQYGSIVDAGVEVPVKVPVKAIAGMAKVDVTFSPTLVGGLDGAFKTMRDDPLQTWEVMLSRGVLASDYLRLKPVLGDAVAWPAATDTVNHALAEAKAFQAPNGGMAFWVPRDNFVSRYLSVYTALAFDWLDKAGHRPSATVEKKLWHYLRKQVLDDNSAPTLRAGAMAALAMSSGGHLHKDEVADLLPKLKRMRLFGQALLLDAAVASHDRHSADTIVRSLLDHAGESAGEISFNQRVQTTYVDFLATPLRSNCVILGALSRYHTVYGSESLVGGVAQKLMRWVVAQRGENGGWPNSQENVFCSTAITHYADAYETPVKDLVGTLTLPGQTPQRAKFVSRATPVAKLAGPVTKPGRRFQVKFGRHGHGRLYYSVQLHYAMPPNALPAADAGMTLTRHYAVQRGKTWQPVTADTVLERGDIVRVTLDVDAPTTRHHVVLADPLPGAFEAVNRKLATAVGSTPAKQPGVTELTFEGGGWPNLSIVNGGFYHRETHFDAVRFFAGNLPAGHYRLVYAAQVIAQGSFVAPAPTIKEIYQPDVFGRGLPTHVKVSMPGH